MRRVTLFVVLVFALFVSSAGAAGPAKQVTLLHVNDSHSHLDAWGPKGDDLRGTLGGLPKVAAIVAAEKRSDPNALFVHGGDFMDGDLFFVEYAGVPELKLLQSIGLDALVLGNHEFAFGPDFLKGVLNGAFPSGNGVPVLGTNLDLDKYPALAPWVVPTLIKDVDGISVGIFGLTTPTGALANPKPVVINADLVNVATAAVSDLRSAGVKVIVCVGHIGLDVAEPLAAAVPGIDVIVNAHDHLAMQTARVVDRKGGGKTYIVSAGSRYEWVGRLRLSVDGEDVALVDYALLAADEGVEADSTVQQAVDALKPRIVARFGDVYGLQLAWAAQDIVGWWDADKAKRDTALGNLFTDAYRALTGTDIALEATAYLGDPLPRGPIVGADVFRAMSYVLPGSTGLRPWRLVSFKAKGSALLGALEVTLAFPDYQPQVSGIRLQYDSVRRPYHRILLNTVEVNGAPLDPNALYSVTTNEAVYSVLKTLMAVQDVIKWPDFAFDAARLLMIARGEVGPGASNRLRDVAAVPGKSNQVKTAKARTR